MRRRRRQQRERLLEGTRHRDTETPRAQPRRRRQRRGDRPGPGGGGRGGGGPGGGGGGDGSRGGGGGGNNHHKLGRRPEDVTRSGLTPKLGKLWPRAPESPLLPSRGWFLRAHSRSFKLMPIESVIPPNHLILCRPLLLLPSIFLSQHQGLFQ